MKHVIWVITLIGLIVCFPFAPPAQAGLEPFIGEIMMFGGNFCPRGWTDANGQLLPIAQNQALFSLLGTIYGGDGRTTFALPDLRGRIPLHTGQGPGLSNRKIGSKGGEETHTLTTNEMPSHAHNLQGTNSSGTSFTPEGMLSAKTHRNTYASAKTGGVTQMAPQSVSAIGNGQPHNNMPPFITIRYCIALQGIYPSRN